MINVAYLLIYDWDIDVKKEIQHLIQLPTIINMGIHPSHQPPTVVSMSTRVGVVGVRVTDHPKAQVPLTLPNR